MVNANSRRERSVKTSHPSKYSPLYQETRAPCIVNVRLRLSISDVQELSLYELYHVLVRGSVQHGLIDNLGLKEDAHSILP